MNQVKLSLVVTMAIAFAFASAAARADDSRLQPITAATGETQVKSRISQTFADFAGSDANASSLVGGLRSGTEITLTTPPGALQPSSVSFVPPTRPMGNGNVFISLALAKQQLASLGITQPTPQQIQAALVGGTVSTGTGAATNTVTLTGVLTQRSQGMGFGNIARSQGVTLGSVISGMKSANHGLSMPLARPIGAAPATEALPLARPIGAAPATEASAAGTTRMSTALGGGHGHGIVTATGGSAAATRASVSTTQTGRGNGIVTAAAGPAGAGVSPGRGNGIVTAAAGPAGAGVSPGSGHGNHGIVTSMGETHGGVSSALASAKQQGHIR